MENKLKKTLYTAGAVVTAAIVALGSAGMADDSAVVNEQVAKITQLENSVASLNHDVSSLNEQIVVKDNLIKELENEEPKVIEKNVTNPINQELLDAFDFLVEFPEYSEAIYDDLDDDEGALIPERIARLKESHAKVIANLEKEFVNEVDKEEVAGVKIDEDDVEKVKIYDDFEDAELIKYDWDDDEFTWKVKVKFEHDDDDFKVFTISDVDEGSVEDIDFEDVE